MKEPALKYFGSKWRDAHKIIQYFPPHRSYVEPYGGSASILLQKNPSPLETYNDLSEDVVNFFRCLREKPRELISHIELTPYSKQEFNLAFESCECRIERARRFYIRSWQGYGSSCFRRSGWRFLYQQSGGEDVVKIFNRTDHLWKVAHRLKAVQIENDGAIAVIRRYGRNPDSLIYCDPPYVLNTRTIQDGYDYEMSDHQHEELHHELSKAKGKILLSGFDCPMYQHLYRDWNVVSWDSRTNSAKSQARESLWMNFDPHESSPLLKLLSGKR